MSSNGCKGVLPFQLLTPVRSFSFRLMWYRVSSEHRLSASVLDCLLLGIFHGSEVAARAQCSRCFVCKRDTSVGSKTSRMWLRPLYFNQMAATKDWMERYSISYELSVLAAKFLFRNCRHFLAMIARNANIFYTLSSHCMPILVEGLLKNFVPAHRSHDSLESQLF